MSTPDQPAAAATVAAQIIRKLALELAFAQPGEDTGLLPINSFLMQIEELLPAPSSPPEVVAAVGQARQWLDAVFTTTATFDAPSIVRLGEWNDWMDAALARWPLGLPLPSRPVHWSPAAKPIPDAGQSLPPAGVAGKKLPLADRAAQKLPTAPAPDGEGGESALLLNLEADREFLREFINESQEHLQNIEQGVLVLEEHPADADTLNSIFRAFHTFKGGAGFANLTAIKDLAHELESLLEAVRQHDLTVDSEIITLILDGGDTLGRFVSEISAQLGGQKAGQPIFVPTQKLLRRVRAALAGEAQGLEVAADVGTAPQPPPAVGKPPANPRSGDEPRKQGTPSAVPPAGFVKVDTAKLDSLVDQVGEFVIAQSMVVEDPDVRALPSHRLARNLAQLRRITTELQHTAMSLRMVPIRVTFQKMTRLVRDLAATQEKQVQLVLDGEETDLDRNIVEMLSDPLVHMIRNAVDHGIERPAARAAKGKPGLGTIHLRAFHQGGTIVVQIEDDGNGLNRERILAKASERGLLKEGETLTDKAIHELIFAPGFSTAETVTDISGRGVGMDVVRRNIEKLRGKVDIDSVPGQGTTFTVFLPLTLAIIDGMIVGVGGERYIIPTLAVRESFRPTPEMISTVHQRGEMVNVRGRLCPLLRLYQHFNLPPRVTDPCQAIIVVVEAGRQTRCLMVDELLGKQEVVIKSLDDTLKSNPSLAGGAILGDGQVGLILDVDSLVRLNGNPHSRTG